MDCMNRWTITQLSLKEPQWNNFISEKTNYFWVDDETLGPWL